MPAQQLYHEMIVALFRPETDHADPGEVDAQCWEIVEKIEAAIKELSTDLPVGWKLETEG